MIFWFLYWDLELSHRLAAIDCARFAGDIRRLASAVEDQV
jgi:hypothetical protein